MGVPGAEMRRSTAQVPGSPIQIEFLEFKGVDRAPLRTRPQDPGSARLQIRVRDLDSAMTTVKRAGAAVVSTGGEPIVIGDLRLALVRELNNLFLVMVQAQSSPPRELK